MAEAFQLEEDREARKRENELADEVVRKAFHPQPERFQPMIGDVEDRRFEHPHTGFPAADEESVDDYLSSINKHHDAGLDELIKQAQANSEKTKADRIKRERSRRRQPVRFIHRCVVT